MALVSGSWRKVCDLQFWDTAAVWVVELWG